MDHAVTLIATTHLATVHLTVFGQPKLVATTRLAEVRLRVFGPARVQATTHLAEVRLNLLGPNVSLPATTHLAEIKLRVFGPQITLAAASHLAEVRLRVFGPKLHFTINTHLAEVRLRFLPSGYAYGAGPGSTITVLNTETMAITERNCGPFSSFCLWQGKILAAGPGGLYTIEGDDFAGTQIDALAKTGLVDFGTTNLKRISSIIADFEGDGIGVSVIGDGEETLSTQSVSSNPSPGVHTERMKPGRGGKSRALGFDISNVNGGALSLKDLEVLMELLTRKV